MTTLKQIPCVPFQRPIPDSLPLSPNRGHSRGMLERVKCLEGWAGGTVIGLQMRLTAQNGILRAAGGRFRDKALRFIASLPLALTILLASCAAVAFNSADSSPAPRPGGAPSAAARPTDARP